ncbi:MAG: helix-turn-helix transcriptional regulator [Actinomycetota bacterium]
MHPLERLVNLVALLLDSRRPLTFEEIRDLLTAYGQGDLATAKRMFERDKDVLRDIGVPVELVATDVWDVEQGYTISKDRYYLPEITFTPEEMSALFVAAHGEGEDSSAEQAVRKLLYGVDGGVLAGLSRGPLAAGSDAAGTRLTLIADAISRQRSVRFGYRTAKGTPSTRHVDPHGLVWRGGHWYVVGLDRDRGDIRAFRLSRLQAEPKDVGEGSAPPDGFRAVDHVQAGPWRPGAAAARARIGFSPAVAWWATSEVPGAEMGATDVNGWAEVEIPAAQGGELAEWVLSFGPDAKVLSPDWLRDEVTRRLVAVLGSL